MTTTTAAEDSIVPAAAAREGAPRTSSTLDFLLRRMRSRSDFPALASAISAINRMAGEETGSTGALADAILRDFALTQKLLRLVNSASYGQFAATRTATISRAIVILGVDTVRSIAISLLLLDQIGDRRQAAQLREDFLRASLGALLARSLSGSLRLGNPEEAYICALFHHLGRLLCSFYLADEAEAVRALIAAEALDENTAALRVLGISYEQLGIGVARDWGFPETMVDSLRHLPPGAPNAGAVTPMRALASLACELCTLLEAPESAPRGPALEQLLRRYRAVLAVGRGTAEQAIAEADKGLDELAAIYQIGRGGTAFGRPLALAREDAAEASALDASALPVADLAADPDSILALGIQEVAEALLEGCALSDVLRIVTETVYRALRPGRVFLCLRDGRSGEMQARFALGDGAEARRPRFRFPIGRGDDLFDRVLARDQDLLVSDTSEPRLRERLPRWYREGIDAVSFLVLPLRLREVPVALLYADSASVGGIVVAPSTLALLRSLRKQALLAIKQAQG